jgi:hypothetical protein
MAGPLSELRWEAAAIADLLASGSLIPVRPLLCIRGATLPQAHRSVESVQVVTHRQLAEIVRHGSRLQPRYVEHATARALELLRPAV